MASLRAIANFVLVASHSLEWLREEGFSIGSVGIVQNAMGRGLQSTLDLSPGEMVLSVPLHHIFWAENLRNLNPLPMEDILATSLAERRHFTDDVLQRLLPQELSHPLFFQKEDWRFVEKLVSASLFHSLEKDFLESYERVGGRVEMDDYRWAHAVLRSRGHSIPIYNDRWESIWGLVPLADLLNMAEKPDLANVNCSTRYLQGGRGMNGTFTCTASKYVKEGSAMLTEYMSKTDPTSALLLREYGFVPKELPNDGLSFLPTGCHRLHCAQHLREVQHLEQQLKQNLSSWIAHALQNSSSLLTMEAAAELKLLAQHERTLLFAMEREYQPQSLYNDWRGETVALSTDLAGRILKDLRDPNLLHTLAWDKAIWNAGQLLLQETMWKESVQDLAIELLFSHHDFPPKLELAFRLRRHQLLTQAALTPQNISENLTGLHCAFTAQALLNGNAWPVSAAEQKLLPEVPEAVQQMYVPDRFERLCPRAAALKAEREWELEEPIDRCRAWTAEGEPTKTRELYESYPYPSWRRFGFGPSRNRSKVSSSLLAGVGTGKAILVHMEHFMSDKILAVDLSKRSLQVAKRQLLALGKAASVTFLQCDFTMLEGKFDVIESIGVLHHLVDPSQGFAALKRLLAPQGLLVLGLYSRIARRSIPVMRELALETSQDEFRDWLVRSDKVFHGRNLSDEELGFKEEFLSEFSLGSQSNFADLLFHPVEHVYELPQVEALLAAHGLYFNGIRVPAGASGVADRWTPFFTPERQKVLGWPQMPLLAFLHRIETELEPLLFTNMYVFTASHGERAVLGNMSLWVDATEDALSLPLPFEESWSQDVLALAVSAYCSRVLHLVKNGLLWIPPKNLNAWLEAKVAYGHHAAKLARSLASVDAATHFCSQVEDQILASKESGSLGLPGGEGVCTRRSSPGHQLPQGHEFKGVFFCSGMLMKATEGMLRYLEARPQPCRLHVDVLLRA